MVFFSSNVALTLQRTDISQYIVSFLSQIAVLYLFTLIVNNSIYIFFFFTHNMQHLFILTALGNAVLHQSESAVK